MAAPGAATIGGWVNGSAGRRPPMTAAARTLASDYMAFAKLETGARYNLASSGVADCALADLGADLGELELHGDDAYGWRPLIEAIAARFAVPPQCVVTAAAASFANHLALAGLVAPGDEVLVEAPTYELLLSALGYLQAKVRRFERRPEREWRLDPDEVAERLTPATRLIVLTNLHNPSGALAQPAAIEAVAAAAAKVGASVLIDEVYLERTFGAGPPRTAFRPGANIVVTSSLTKAYGLSGLRCGWILAGADLARRLWRLNDLYAVKTPHIAEQLSLTALARLPALRARATAILEANRAAYRAILGGHTGLDQTIFDHATTVFPRLAAGDGDAFAALLADRYETSVVPGRFFGRPTHIRIGLGADPAMTRVGLERIAEALASGLAKP
jgi:aspartate/methionine/tyrosine aminotransferase